MGDLVKMNDWEIRKFLSVIIAIQLAMIALIGLATMGLDIPVLRQIIGFVYLSFIPGIIILRIMKIHQLNTVETFLYSVGSSIAFLMSVGLLMNTIYPHVGIPGPISTLPLIVTLSVIILIMCFIAYKRDKDFPQPVRINLKKTLSLPVLLLLLLPFLSILGTHLMNLHQDNRLLLSMFGVIALIMALIAFTRFIPRELYPVAIAMIAISMLFHTTLISRHLSGADTRYEYFLHKLVETRGFWDSTSPANTYNSMLSVTIWPTVYSCLLNIEGTWIFKVIYPLFFALIPLGLYEVFRKQVGEKIAVLAAFFFISYWQFYNKYDYPFSVLSVSISGLTHLLS